MDAIIELLLYLLTVGIVSIVLYYHKDKFLTPSARRFIALCKDYEADYPLPDYNGLFE